METILIIFLAFVIFIILIRLVTPEHFIILPEATPVSTEIITEQCNNVCDTYVQNNQYQFDCFYQCCHDTCQHYGITECYNNCVGNRIPTDS